MNCPNLLEDGNPCGDEGRSCDACQEADMREYSYLRFVPLGAVTGRLSDQDKQDMRDSGRGHLVGES